MNTWLLHLLIAAVIYVIGVVVVFSRLFYLATKYDLKKFVVKWRRILVIDASLWPYYAFRYGVEGFYKEIK